MKKIILAILTLLLFNGVCYGIGWCQQRDATKDELNLMDIVFVRPFGVAAGIIGTGVFIVSLPFTIPTKSVDKAAGLLIVEPFRFSFARPFPDVIEVDR